MTLCARSGYHHLQEGQFTIFGLVSIKTTKTSATALSTESCKAEEGQERLTLCTDEQARQNCQAFSLLKREGYPTVFGKTNKATVTTLRRTDRIMKEWINKS